MAVPLHSLATIRRGVRSFIEGTLRSPPDFFAHRGVPYAGSTVGTRFVVVGDIHGRFEELAEALDEARRRWGTVDFVLAVGDVEPNRDRKDQAGVVAPARHQKLGDFPLLVAGDIVLGAPLYFIAGNHDPYPTLDRAGPGEWAPGVWWLGRCGVTPIAEVTVAYLSGIYSPRLSELEQPYRRGPKQRTYWHRSELAQIIDATSHLHAPPDILLTHDWPAGVGTNRRGHPVGDPSLRQLVETLQPRVHACGHHHYDQQATIGNTRILCLAKPWVTPQHLRGVTAIERSPDGNLHILA